jgi:hypothetical protein
MALFPRITKKLIQACLFALFIRRAQGSVIYRNESRNGSVGCLADFFGCCQTRARLPQAIAHRMLRITRGSRLICQRPAHKTGIVRLRSNAEQDQRQNQNLESGH